MDSIIRKNDDGRIQLDIRKLITQRKDILDKYHDSLNIHFDSKNRTWEMDKYLLNIIEEMAESLEVIINDNYKTYVAKSFNQIHKPEYLEEIIDIFNYSATTLSLFFNCPFLDKYTFQKEKFLIICDATYIDCVENDINHYFLGVIFPQFISKLLVDIIKIRRLYPERKWHKPAKDFNDDENIERLIESCQILAKILNSLAQLLLGLTENNVEKINEMIQDKFSYILSLPLLKNHEEN